MLKYICKFSLTLLLLVGCSKQETPLKQHLSLNLGQEPVSLDPRTARNIKDLTLIRHLFEGLYREDAKGIPQPAIVKEAHISDDLLTYTFTLKETYWSDGTPLTANDFAYAWKKVLDPEFASDYSQMLFPIKNARSVRLKKGPIENVGINVLDDQTIQVTLESPTPYFLNLLAFPTYFPVNEAFEEKCPNWPHLFGKLDQTSFLCNGPFEIVSWFPGDRVNFKKNPNYWDTEKVSLESIEFTIITDNSTESHLYEKGKLDWLGQPISHAIATELIGKYQAEGTLQSFPVAGTFWINFNTELFPFNHPKIRKAFTYALNRQELITHVLQGGQLAATSPIPPTMQLADHPYFSDGNSPYANILFDEALTDLGLSRNDFPKITFSFGISPRNKKIAELLQRQWEEGLGVTIALDGCEYGYYREKVRQGEYQIGNGEWIGDFNDPITFLELFKTSDTALNPSRWKEEKYVLLLDLSDKTSDRKKRLGFLKEAEELLMEAMPIAPLYYYSFEYVKPDYVQDVVLLPTGLPDFKWAKIKICNYE